MTRLEPIPLPEPVKNPKLSILRWCLLVQVGDGETATRTEHTFTRTHDLCAYLKEARPGVTVVSLEVEGPEDVSDVVSFFGTPVHRVAAIPAPYLPQMVELFRR